MSTPETREVPIFEQRNRFEIREQVSTRAIEALMANYRDGQQAFLELIDNAVDNREDTSGSNLEVRIRVNKNELSVFNRGGRGLDREGLGNFFVWGYSEKTRKDIGFYGVGGKSAMGFLARGMEVRCSSKGSDEEYVVSDPNWESRPEGEFKTFGAEVKKANTADGYFQVRLTNLKQGVNVRALSEKLADIYRQLLLDGSVTIMMNGKRVEPLEIRYVEDNPNLKPELLRVQTRFGDWIDLKVGILEEGQRVKPGIRCYYRGRLIEEEQFFGHPTPAHMSQASRLIGEADLDFVPVTPNKANFIHGSPQWDHAEKRIHDVLIPFYSKLAKFRIEQKSQVQAYEKELAGKAKRVLEHVFATTGLVTKTMLPGESKGRRPPTRRGKPVTPPTRPGGSGPREGQTPPLLDATIGEVKRWGATFGWDIVSMGTSAIRSDVVDEEGKQVLKINADYPLYQAAKKAGNEALEIYMAETGIMRIAELVSKGQSIEEYVNLVNSLLGECGAIYQIRIHGRSPQKRRDR